MEFKWAKIHKHEREWFVGDDQYDVTPGPNGLPPFVLVDAPIVMARKRAREWLAKQPDAELIYFSLERTLSMYVERDLRAGVDVGDESKLTDEESDALLDITERHN